MDESDASDGNELMPCSPPAKRRRTDITRSFHFQLEDVLEQTRTGGVFWQDDGDIVLGVEHHFFKIHRSRLMCSLIFADMLELPQPEVIENLDGCPLVHLASDSAKDWQVVLGWMYDPNYFSVKPAITFDMLAGATRISTKYEIAGLRDIMKHEIMSRWPKDISKMTTNSLPHAAEAICLARECDIPEILPAAFYALSVQKWTYGADGGRSHLILAPADLRRLIAGREALQDFLVKILIAPLNYTDQYALSFCPQCKPAVERLWITRMAPNPSSPWGCWLLRELLDMTKQGRGSNLKLCWRCDFDLESLIFVRISALKESMSKFFML